MTGSRRRLVPWVVVGVAVVVAAGLAGPPGGGRALDPDSTSRAGAKALVETLGRLGAAVSVIDEPPAIGSGVDRLVVLDDRLSDDQRAAVADWVRAGGLLIVADSTSPLTGTIPTGIVDDDGAEPGCDLPALAGVVQIKGPIEALEVPDGAVACFPIEGGAWLVGQAVERGSVVALGGAAPLLNINLDRADNAVVAAGLLAPDGGGTVGVLHASPVGGGNRGLTDLLPDGVKAALWQVVVAGVVLGLAVARRIGRPLVDDHPVRLDGAALVLAAGGLHERHGHDGSALTALADAARRDAAQALGLGPSASVAALVDAAAARGLPTDGIVDALDSSGPSWGTDALATARSIHAVRQRILHADV